MNDATPHYLLSTVAGRTQGFGHWRFVLRPIDGTAVIEVADVEPDVWGERLELLTVVRALESLDQPSKVTLVGCTRYVEQGILFGLAEWRETDWRWEYFGQMAPVRDADLWQRMDRILQFHRVDCEQRRIDTPHATLAGPHWDLVKNGGKWVDYIARRDWLKYKTPLLALWCGACVVAASRFWQAFVRAAADLGSSLLVHRS